MTSDLFDTAPIVGLRLEEAFITCEQERGLLEQIEALDLAPFRFHGWTGKRLTRSFGWRYDFDDASFRQTDPLPGWLIPIRDRAARFAGLRPDDFPHALVTRYDVGAGIGWHRDRPQFDKVVGISLGAPAVLRFRQRTPSGFRRVRLPLEPRSAYLLSGEARQEWEHGIAPGEAFRCSITFRSLREVAAS
ncbi:MAG: alpha-ketoglutarate-dependent dioxygenase AlkB [Pseudomonadota bacterium]|nr:alpha-ketoglutarate-dependent dioxygenase AlkB [Pseudomonadota bacterium]